MCFGSLIDHAVSHQILTSVKMFIFVSAFYGACLVAVCAAKIDAEDGTLMLVTWILFVIWILVHTTCRI